MDGLYGIAAINASNGWAISVVGITIVFSGLVLLALTISQLHKVLAMWENPKKIKAWFRRSEPDPAAAPEIETAPVPDVTEEQKETIRQFSLLVRTMEDHFPLPRLLQMARVSGIKAPHANLHLLLTSGILYPDNDGWFCWDQLLFEKTVSQ